VIGKALADYYVAIVHNTSCIDSRGEVNERQIIRVSSSSKVKFLYAMIIHCISIFDCLDRTELEEGTSSGRAGAVGMLQAMLLVMLNRARPICYYFKVLKGVMSAVSLGVVLAGRFVLGSSLLGPRS
jgi:hypothetical protein